MILTPLQKLPKNVGHLGKLIVAKGFKNLPKVQKLLNLVTLRVIDLFHELFPCCKSVVICDGQSDCL